MIKKLYFEMAIKKKKPMHRINNNIRTFYDDIVTRDNRGKGLKDTRREKRSLFSFPCFISCLHRNISDRIQYVIYRFVSTPRVGYSGTVTLSQVISVRDREVKIII
jgi:hypothetical protein